MLKLLKHPVESLVSGAAAIAAALLLFLVFFIVTDVFLRYAMQSAIPGVMEFTSLIMASILFLGFSKAQAAKQHISVDFFTDKILSSSNSPSLIRRNWTIVIYTATLIFFAMIFWRSINFFTVSLTMGEYLGGAEVRVPIYPARGILLLGTFLMVLQTLKDIVELVKKKL